MEKCLKYNKIYNVNNNNNYADMLPPDLETQHLNASNNQSRASLKAHGLKIWTGFFSRRILK